MMKDPNKDLIALAFLTFALISFSIALLMSY